VLKLRLLRTFSVACLVILVACGNAQNDEAIAISAEDPEMMVAISQARATLPDFWNIFKSPSKGESDFALKVRIEDANGAEHIWVTEIQRENEKIVGVISNVPNVVETVSFGERVEVPERNVSDWLYVRDGSMVGNFTARPLLRDMSEGELRQVTIVVADP